MPVNFQQLQQQVRQMSSRAPQRYEWIRKAHEDAEGLLHRYAHDPDALRLRVNQILEKNASLRCAIPTAEVLDQGVPCPETANPMVILAADGSQINPDRHAPVNFGVINVGVFRMIPGAGQPPQEIVQTRLLDWDEINPAEGPMSEEWVALERDLSERRVLVDLAKNEKLPVVTLTDGPLELYRESGDRKEYQKKVEEYLSALRRMAELQVATGGYVDKPANNLVIRLLELMMLTDEECQDGVHYERRLHPLADIDLYYGLLAPGERSAVFAIQSVSAKRFTGELELHFFYLNVGTDKKPNLARVEVPAWVVGNLELLNQLHAVLVSQARQMGGRPYPYALHRAHEVALVGFDEKRQLQDLIMREVRNQGLEVEQGSNKQFAKDISGSRTRYP